MEAGVEQKSDVPVTECQAIFSACLKTAGENLL
jgi:hypothetical protein